MEADTDGEVDFTPFLDTGVELAVVEVGFEGDFTTLNVTTLGEQTGDDRIQEAVDLVEGSTVNVWPGDYEGTVDIENMDLTLRSVEGP